MAYCKEAFTFEVVKSLLTHGDLYHPNELMPINDETNPEQTLFQIAISNIDDRLFEYLLELGADPNIRSGNFGTPLHSIASNGNIDECRRLAWAWKLIFAGADVNADVHPGDQVTALYLAVRWGHCDLAKLLINHGADVNVRTNSGVTANDSITPLFVSHSVNNKMLKLLLQNGAWINVRAPNKWQTPLIDAINYGDLERIKLLLVYGADVNFTTGIDFWNIDESPLHIAVKQNFTEALELLLNSPEINVNVVNSEGESVLHYAARYLSNVEMVKTVLDAGVDVNIVNNKGEAAINCVNDGSNPVIIEIRDYIVKLKIAGFHINKINLEAIKDHNNEILHQDCLKEVEILKTWIPSSNISFYRVMHSTEAKSVSYLRHLEAEELKKSLAELKLKIYDGKLSYILDSIAARASLLEDTEWFIYQTLCDQLPDTFLRYVSTYFKVEELQYLRNTLMSFGEY